jgi:hypothetical protein
VMAVACAAVVVSVSHSVVQFQQHSADVLFQGTARIVLARSENFST